MAKIEPIHTQYALAMPEQYQDVEITNATTETGHGGEHGKDGAFPPFDTTTFGSQLIWLALTFGIFYYVMSKFALPRLANILETRRDRIANDMEEAERLKAKTDESVAAYEKALSEARSKSQSIATKAREEAQAELDAEKAETDKVLQAKIAEAEASISTMKSDALKEVDSIAADLTVSLVAKIIGDKITKTDAKKAVDDVKDAANA